MKILIFLIFFIVIIVAIAIALLKGFDKIAGRGPAQIKTGINKSKLINDNENRYPCPRCAELIKKEAKVCRFCKSEL